MKNLQYFFDNAYKGLASQGFEKSVVTVHGRWQRESCRYRHPDGVKKCAIGWSIPDNKYKPSLEGKSLFSYYILRALGLSEKDDFLWGLDYLRKEHDKSETPEDMKLRLETFAKEYNLTIPQLG